jgi:hypothetical protein
MEDWQKHLWKIVTTAGLEVESFVRDVNKALVTVAAEFTEALEVTIEDIQEAFFEEEDRSGNYQDEDNDRLSGENSTTRGNFRDSFERSFESYFLEEDMESDMGFYDIYYLEATSQHQPACVGCRHYHGRVYNGNLLVCAMHPTGQQDGQCSDWEG